LKSIATTAKVWPAAARLYEPAANLLPYSRWTVDHHLAVLQLYEWSHSVYRCTGQMLSVSKMTVHGRMSSFGYDLLPMAALFGMVRTNGVVGINLAGLDRSASGRPVPVSAVVRNHPLWRRLCQRHPRSSGMSPFCGARFMEFGLEADSVPRMNGHVCI
jgi:hypothetical protein